MREAQDGFFGAFGLTGQEADLNRGKAVDERRESVGVEPFSLFNANLTRGSTCRDVLEAIGISGRGSAHADAGTGTRVGGDVQIQGR